MSRVRERTREPLEPESARRAVAARPGRPDTLARIKRVVVGPPMATERLVHERLGKPTALAVFASDNLSSSAYATEEILRVLLLAGLGTAAFTLVVPRDGCPVGTRSRLKLSTVGGTAPACAVGTAHIAQKPRVALDSLQHMH